MVKCKRINYMDGDLEPTVDLMLSSDFKTRFLAEYWQTKIRCEKLKDLNVKIEAAAMCYTHGDVPCMVAPKHACPDELLRRQEHVMMEYLHILELRAAIEGIELVAKEE